MLNRNIAEIIVMASCLLVGACSVVQERSDELMDTGLPLNENTRAYDVDRYTLRHDILHERKAIAGSATVSFTAVADLSVLELDFDGNYNIERVESGGQRLDYQQTERKLLVTLGGALSAGDAAAVTVHYEGRPVVAERPPWQGGFTWEETPSGKPWIATSFQGEGCDIWWPCKDHPSDEPSGVDLYITVADGLTVASNGVLQGVTDEASGRKTWHWQTNVPTNFYGIALNIAPYVVIEDEYTSINGTVVPLVFYAIEEHEEQARALVENEIPGVLEFFERRLGPYPWGEEKIGVAETPHLGMEHQTINAYGNEFKRDKYGFDWLFHHEIAHEWFGNLISTPNYADLWLHEGTGAYMQPAYTEEVMGDAAVNHRMYDAYLRINACMAVAPRGELSDDQMSDMAGDAGTNIYSKGSWVLHSLRYLVGEEAFWDALRILLYDTNDPYNLQPPIETRHRTTDDFLAIASEVAGDNLDWFFEVYVRQGELPALEAEQDGDDVVLRWTNVGEIDFRMPVPVRINGEMQRIEFANNEARLANVSERDMLVDPHLQILRHLSSRPTCEEQQEELSEDDE